VLHSIGVDKSRYSTCEWSALTGTTENKILKSFLASDGLKLDDLLEVKKTEHHTSKNEYFLNFSKTSDRISMKSYGKLKTKFLNPKN
jgi:hypothetical protein